MRRMNRLQNQLDLLHINAITGLSSVVLTEKADTYVDINFTDDLKYLVNGTQFIISSERSGFKHLYLYEMDGTLIRQLTSGDWEVAEFLGVDEDKKILYFTSTEVSPLERHLYSLDIDLPAHYPPLKHLIPYGCPTNGASTAYCSARMLSTTWNTTAR